MLGTCRGTGLWATALALPRGYDDGAMEPPEPVDYEPIIERAQDEVKGNVKNVVSLLRRIQERYKRYLVDDHGDPLDLDCCDDPIQDAIQALADGFGIKP